MRKILGIIFGFWLGGLLLAAGAEMFPLADGTSVSGDVVKYDGTGALIHTPADAYTNIVWTLFTQDALKQLAQNPKIRPYAIPFIVPSAEQRPKETIAVHEVSRLELPPKAALFAALFSTPVGLVVMFLIYGANLYAAMEIAICRSRPVGMVMGVAAVLPILGPLIFLSLPVPGATPVAPATKTEPAQETAVGSKVVPAASAPPTRVQMPGGGGVHLAKSTWQPPPASRPAPQVFQRGQFTFNRRFFETKFAVFFSTIRREADKDMILLVKTPRGRYEVEHITRISANDIHFEVAHGAARQEVMVPFGEIQEIQLKHKDT